MSQTNHKTSIYLSMPCVTRTNLRPLRKACKYVDVILTWLRFGYGMVNDVAMTLQASILNYHNQR
jgi:hypothetical protein